MMQRLRVPLLEATKRAWDARPGARVLTNERFCRELVSLGRAERLLEPPPMQSAPVLSAPRAGKKTCRSCWAESLL